MPSARLTITPTSAQVSAKGGTIDYLLRCKGDCRLAFKIRIKANCCSYYAIRPTAGFVPAGGQRYVTFIRKGGGNAGKEYMMIQYIVAPSRYDPREPFVKGAEIGRIKIDVQVVDEEPDLFNLFQMKGKKVTDDGQIWDKEPNAQEDNRIEKELDEAEKRLAAEGNTVPPTVSDDRSRIQPIDTDKGNRGQDQSVPCDRTLYELPLPEGGHCFVFSGSRDGRKLETRKVEQSVFLEKPSEAAVESEPSMYVPRPKQVKGNRRLRGRSVNIIKKTKASAAPVISDHAVYGMPDEQPGAASSYDRVDGNVATAFSMPQQAQSCKVQNGDATNRVIYGPSAAVPHPYSPLPESPFPLRDDQRGRSVVERKKPTVKAQPPGRMYYGTLSPTPKSRLAPVRDQRKEPGEKIAMVNDAISKCLNLPKTADRALYLPPPSLPGINGERQCKRRSERKKSESKTVYSNVNPRRDR